MFSYHIKQDMHVFGFSDRWLLIAANESNNLSIAMSVSPEYACRWSLKTGLAVVCNTIKKMGGGKSCQNGEKKSCQNL